MKVENFHFQIKNLKEQELLAYEVGVHLGDGSLQFDKRNRVYRTIYCGDSRNDFDFYTKILPEILQKLYNKLPAIYKRKNENTIIANLNSKEIAQKKIQVGLPIGNKIKLEKVPDWLNKKELIPHFLRGLADTDFCVSFKKNRKGVHCEPRIELFTNNGVLVKFVFKSLTNLGFKVAFENATNKGFREFRIRMYGKKMLCNWIELIGFYNPKHLSKIMVYEKFGYCPIYLSTQERLNLI